ncbi:MAG: MerR family mercuric resistance operon transcriptional regulator [Chlamydiales bacterium]|jgi:MerR family mercuric resistance operon transcriptional regulator
MTKKKTFTAGILAKQAKVNIQTLRYYERRGLLPEPNRSSTGYRQYGENDVKCLKFIKNAQKLGFSLEEIKEMLSFRIADSILKCDI